MSINLPPFPSRDVTPFLRSQSLAEALVPSSKQSNTSTTSLGTVYRPRNRRVSVTSFKSASSAPVESRPLNDENQGPLRQFLRPDESPKGPSVPKPLQRKTSNPVSHKSSWGTDIPVPPRSRASSLVQESGPLDDVDLDPSCNAEGTREYNFVDQTASSGVHLGERQSSDRNQPKSGEPHEHKNETQEKSAISGEHPFRRWVQTLRRRKSSHSGTSTARIASWSSDEFEKRSHGNDFLTVPLGHDNHKRSSLASSRFITGVRTATASVQSSSILPDSRRNTMFSDHRTTNRSSYLSNGDVRGSTESGQPLVSHSIDDAAWTRAVKRRQVIQEIVSSEESYVADMKVLVNVSSGTIRQD